MTPNFASQIRAAFRQHGLNTGSKSPGELADDTQDFAKSPSAARFSEIVSLRNSLSSRVFSMAMTAWAAKFCTSSICLSVNGRTSCR